MSDEARQRYLEIDSIGSVTVARLLYAELTREDEIEVAGQRLLRLIDELGCRLVVVDLARVERMHSAMIGKLLALYKKARSAGGKVAVCQANAALLEELQALHLHRLMGMYPTEQEAVAALASGPCDGPPPRPPSC
jgi:anti-anti-sigma factor